MRTLEPPKDLVQLFTRVQRYLRKGWIKGDNARTARRGAPVDAAGSTARFFCLYGAIERASAGSHTMGERARNLLKSFTEGRDITSFNDSKGTRKIHVLAAVAKAKKAARGGSSN